MRSEDHKVTALCKYFEKVAKIHTYNKNALKGILKREKITPLPKHFEGIIIERCSVTFQISSKERLFSLSINVVVERVIEPKITYWYTLKTRRKMNC